MERLLVIEHRLGEWTERNQLDSRFPGPTHRRLHQLARRTLAAQMVRQYPWLYRRFLLFGWRKRSS